MGCTTLGRGSIPVLITLCVDPAQIQPPYPNAPHHVYTGPPGQGAYYQQPGTIFVPVHVVPTLAGMPHHAFAPERPYLNPIDISYGTQGAPHVANTSTPITPAHPSSPPSANHEDHRRGATNPNTVHDLPLSPTSSVSYRHPRSLHSPQASTNNALLISDLKSLQ